MIETTLTPAQATGGSLVPGRERRLDAPVAPMPPTALPLLHHFLMRASGERMFLTSAWDQSQAGTVIRWAQPCASTPPLIAVAFPRGQRVSRVISESRVFALCRIAADDRILARRFDVRADADWSTDDGDGPFLGLAVERAPAGSPVPSRVTAWIECEVMFNLDLEADYGLYVGRVIAAGGN